MPLFADSEKGHLQTERRTLEDTLGNFTDYLWAVSFGETFSHVALNNLDRVRFLL